MSKLPLCSSRRIVSALKRLGFNEYLKSPGSHQALVREDADGRKRVAIVPLGKKEIPRGMLRSILEQANVSVEKFLKALK